MAGSLRHVTNNDGTFSGSDLIENLGDAHEALEECVAVIRDLAGGDLEAIAAAHWRWVESHNPNHGLNTSAEAYWSDE